MLQSLRKKEKQYVRQIKYTNKGHLPTKATLALQFQKNCKEIRR